MKQLVSLVGPVKERGPFAAGPVSSQDGVGSAEKSKGLSRQSLCQQELDLCQLANRPCQAELGSASFLLDRGKLDLGLPTGS